MVRKTYSVIVTWREGQARIHSVSEARFTSARESWIDEGYRNLQTEWYEAVPGKAGLPDRFRVFVYWEDSDPPSIEQLQAWGRQAVTLEVED